MRTVILIALFVAAVFAAPSSREGCPEDCVLPDCRCAGVDIPGGLSLDETPQFVMLTFDDAVTISNMPFYRDALYGRTNHNGRPVAATFFNSHEYTDYTLLHELYAYGHEVALHSISHTTDVEYWAEASVDLLAQEFAGQRTLITKFARIPKTEVFGIRMPFLQMAGDNQFEMLDQEDFLYDCSWPTQTYMDPGLWPYTLDHPSPQDCSIPPCPTKSFPGKWIVPMINWRDNSDVVCAMMDACVDIPKDVDGLVEFMKQNFNRQYKGNKAPFGYFVHAAWFNVSPEVHFKAYIKFIDYLQTLPDVYLVGVERVVEWVRNPIPLSQMPTSDWTEDAREVEDVYCTPRSCELVKIGDEWARWMTSCVAACPAVYPWVGNPTGDKPAA